MKVRVLCISKTTESYIQEGMDDFKKRLQHFCKLEWVELPDVKNRKNLSKEKLLATEEESFLKLLKNNDVVYLLDENGKSYSSRKFASFIESRMMDAGGSITFLIGGPYGFSENIYRRANGKISLSAMTFTHQMVRLFFLEQIYRAFSIIKKLPYHHD